MFPIMKSWEAIKQPTKPEKIMKARKTLKPLLSFRITVDHEDGNTPVYAHIKLYNEDDGYMWRIDSDLGDECETLPRPASVSQAKADVRLVYPQHSPFKPFAKWL